MVTKFFKLFCDRHYSRKIVTNLYGVNAVPIRLLICDSKSGSQIRCLQEYEAWHGPLTRHSPHQHPMSSSVPLSLASKTTLSSLVLHARPWLRRRPSRPTWACRLGTYSTRWMCAWRGCRTTSSGRMRMDVCMAAYVTKHC